MVVYVELWPKDGTNLAFLFKSMDQATSFIFTFELVVNLFTHSNDCFRPFYRDPWNLLDAAVVGATLLTALNLSEYRPPRLLRLIRIVRILKLIRRLKSLKRIASALVRGESEAERQRDRDRETERRRDRETKRQRDRETAAETGHRDETQRRRRRRTG